jgi:hypothetical protein
LVLSSYRAPRPVSSTLGHKENMKKIIGIAAIMIILGGWIYLDYSWDERIIKKVAKDGWVPAAVNDSYVIHPWNFIKCSVVGVWFVNPSGMFRLSDDIVVAGVMHFDRDEGQSNSYELFDCSKKLTAYISLEELKAADFTKVKWHSFEEGTPGARLIEFISSQLSSIPRKEKNLNQP